jgi:prepilin-type processing-associated H-X9-DG protein
VATTDKEFRVKRPVVAEGSVTGTSIIREGGTSSQYLMADGSVTTGGGGGVTSIVAGNNITISPVGGTGNVTINSTGNSLADSDQNIIANQIFG